MGNNNSSSTKNEKPIKKSKSTINHINYHSNSNISEVITCPICSIEFSKLTSFKDFNIHLKQCGLEYSKTNKPCQIFLPNDDKTLNNLIYKFSN